MAQIKKPNIVCRWCGKNYYACLYCMKIKSWKSYCCSMDCYTKYTQKILDLRELEKSGFLKSINNLSQEEIDKINNMTPEQAMEQTKDDLKEYIDENPEKSLTDILEIVNEDIEKSQKRKKKS